MSTTKTAQKKTQPNKQTEAPKNAEQGKKNAPTAQKSGTRVNDILNPTASGRIQKLENFRLLAQKHEFLTQKRNDLDRFIISSDGTKEKVMLKNSEGYEFEVSNSQVIEEVLEVVTKKLDLFIEKSEEEVLAFQI